MSFVSVFSIVGIIVLALAVIALAVCVSGISSRLKELTDTVMLEPIQGKRSQMDPYNDMYDLPPRRANASMYQGQDRRGEVRRAPGPQRGSAPQRTGIPQRNGAPQRSAAPQRGMSPQRASYSSNLRDSRSGSLNRQASYDRQDAGYARQAASYERQAAYQEADPYATQGYEQVQTTPAGMRQSYASQDLSHNDPYGDDDFFETYRNRDEESHYLRGRGKPTIPFGADRSVVDRRRDSYVGSVADSEYDPDSIDFTRVQGYKRAGGRY